METAEKPVKLVAVIQCDFAKERCSGFSCADVFFKRTDGFANYPAKDPIIYLPFDCGGCPGRRISRSAAHVIKKSAKKAQIEKDEIVVHLASCMVTDNGHYPPCPHLDYIGKILQRKGLKVRKGSYRSKTAEGRRGRKDYEPFIWDQD